jgi:hypothetical protein
MRKHDLKLQLDKCEFLRKEESYLGHIITSRGVKPDEKKVEAVRNFPVPTTQKLKSFLGLAGYYRRFIPDFSKIAKPLTELLKKNTPYVWNERTESAFNFGRFASTEDTAIQTATLIFLRRSHRSLVIAYVGHRVRKTKVVSISLKFLFLLCLFFSINEDITYIL